MNLELFSKGLSLGFTAGIAPGPLTLLVITQTLQYNLREGIKVSLAPLFTDIPIICFSYLVLSQLASFGWVIGSICFVGSAFLLSMAKDMWFAKPPQISLTKDSAQSVKKGILSNLLNPAPYLFWITIGTPILVSEETSTWIEKLLFIVAMFSVMIGTKVVIALAARKSSSVLQGKTYQFCLRASALIFLIFAINFLLTGYSHLKEYL